MPQDQDDIKGADAMKQAPTPGPLSVDDELIERGLRTIRTYDAVRSLRDALSATTSRLTGYDWNADPDSITKQQGDAFAAADKVFSDLDAAVAAHPDIDLPECEACNGTGKIEEAARTEGANQHSACIRSCDECDGCGFAPDPDLAPTAPVEDHESDLIPMPWKQGVSGKLDVSTAPVEASGSERDFETAEAMAEAWSDRVEIQHMVDVTSAVFAKWASPELLSRFRQQMMAVIQQAYIEGVAARVEAVREKPEKPYRWMTVDKSGFETIYAAKSRAETDLDAVEVTPLYAHPSPTPAADADRVRKEIKAWADTRWPKSHGVGSKGWVDGLTNRVLAALKAEAK